MRPNEINDYNSYYHKFYQTENASVDVIRFFHVMRKWYMSALIVANACPSTTANNY